ncbi:TrmH family RNA methyltransferase [Desulfurispora thermophila]|uniref:TrmH family RNA methyltransferase n=1 Tax=Desulfurispora thermophila TaxID=265470 RepID=UPI00036FB306|nr:RNA methyltransferase [Desulfurispora thermophila]
MHMITSPQNQLVKYLNRLKEKRHRSQEQKFLAEGTRFVEEALAVPGLVEMLVYSPELLPAGRSEPLLELARQAGVSITAVSARVFRVLADTQTPQGVLAVVKMPVLKLDDLALLLGLASQRGNPLLVVVDGVQDPGNLGTIVRSAAAFGASGLVLCRGTVDLFNPKVLRATMGAVFKLPVWQDVDINTLGHLLQQMGLEILLSSPQGDVSLTAAGLTGRVALVIGSEARGVSNQWRQFTRRAFRIPMQEDVESLNAGIAAAVILYEAYRQRTCRP